MTIEERSSERMRAATALASLAIPVGATVILAIDWNDGTPEDEQLIMSLGKKKVAKQLLAKLKIQTSEL